VKETARRGWGGGGGEERVTLTWGGQLEGVGIGHLGGGTVRGGVIKKRKELRRKRASL